MEDKIIVTSIDDNEHYAEGLKVFLYSAYKNSGKEKIIVYLINQSDAYSESLFRLNPNIIINRLSMPGSSIFEKINVRYKILFGLLNNYDKVAWIDNDAVVLKDLGGIWDGVGSNDIKILYRKNYHKKEHKKNRPECFFQGGIYVIGNGDPIKGWIKGIVDGSDGKQEWYTSQALMYLLYMKDKRINHLQLDNTYNDSKFRKNSHIWHCKQSGFDNEIYQEKYKQILKELREVESETRRT